MLFQQILILRWSLLEFIQINIGIMFLKTKLIKEELIAETWQPDRFIRWCLDNEELREIDWVF